jgi:hypothetical protein
MDYKINNYKYKAMMVKLYNSKLNKIMFYLLKIYKEIVYKYKILQIRLILKTLLQRII